MTAQHVVACAKIVAVVLPCCVVPDLGFWHVRGPILFDSDGPGRVGHVHGTQIICIRAIPVLIRDEVDLEGEHP